MKKKGEEEAAAEAGWNEEENWNEEKKNKKNAIAGDSNAIDNTNREIIDSYLNNKSSGNSKFKSNHFNSVSK